MTPLLVRMTLFSEILSRFARPPNNTLLPAKAPQSKTPVERGVIAPVKVAGSSISVSIDATKLPTNILLIPANFPQLEHVAGNKSDA